MIERVSVELVVAEKEDPKSVRWYSPDRGDDISKAWYAVYIYRDGKAEWAADFGACTEPTSLDYAVLFANALADRFGVLIKYRIGR